MCREIEIERVFVCGEIMRVCREIEIGSECREIESVYI